MHSTPGPGIEPTTQDQVFSYPNERAPQEFLALVFKNENKLHFL